jgi:NAD(P)-dependent dehydrogenase (short-subunit alcohol dehydrogenase family)
METLEKRTAIVTGAAGGIGREIVAALLNRGASVVAADVSAEGLEKLAASHAGAGQSSRLHTRRLDISKHEECTAAIDEAAKRFGKVDILVNNGALGMGAIREDNFTNLVGIDEIEPQMWDRFVAVNLSGPWYMTRAVVPGMKKAGWGRIINVTTSMFTMLRGRFHPYGPAKAGLEAMSAGHAEEFKDSGITVNVVVPGGPTDTPMVPESSGIRRQDLIKPSKMTHPMLWLCSEAANGVTGHRYVAANWDETGPVDKARAASEAPIGWPGLAGAPVWPGGRPKD